MNWLEILAVERLGIFIVDFSLILRVILVRLWLQVRLISVTANSKNLDMAHITSLRVNVRVGS